jgi:hypothetical protein
VAPALPNKKTRRASKVREPLNRFPNFPASGTLLFAASLNGNSATLHPSGPFAAQGTKFAGAEGTRADARFESGRRIAVTANAEELVQ